MKRDESVKKGESLLYKTVLDYQYRYNTALKAYKRLLVNAPESRKAIYLSIISECEAALEEVNDVLEFMRHRNESDSSNDNCHSIEKTVS